jgi:hypothetical protein
MLWTSLLDTGVYATSYTITDNNGNCLSPADPDKRPLDVYLTQVISKIVMDPCDGSTLQKWNADPNILDSSPLKNISEK